MMIEVSEELHPEKEWFELAENQTLETLPEFINHLLNDYVHDYGTIVHAVAACAVAAAWAANETAGLTGFQSGFVMWDFIRHWNHKSNQCGMKLINYDNMLYPQYGYKFEKTISKDTWEVIQKTAKEKLESTDTVHPDVVKHWQSIAEGKVPFGYLVEEDK